MIATYRLQLRPEFTFKDVEGILPYLVRLGVSHLYLSPISQARRNSTHGYDVIDHNLIREEFGGRDGFDSLLERVREHNLALILDYVPNHAGVGPRNVSWQDVLAYGPNSIFARYFDVDWDPLKPELHDKILLPFLGDTYGEVFDRGEIKLGYDDGRFFARYWDDRYALSPATYADVLRLLLPHFERTDLYWDFKELAETYESFEPHEREKAEALRPRLIIYASQTNLPELLDGIVGEDLHELLNRQHWRLSYWKTAGYEINYRRFFDINGLVGLRMEDDQVFWDAHRLLGELLALDGVHGVRIDHVDGLFDPHKYLQWLRDLGAQRIWVEKILAQGEVLPEEWPVEGTTGYEFMNDVMGILLRPEARVDLERVYHRYVPEAQNYEETVRQSKEVVMSTTLSSELFRLAYELDRLSESDYHTRDFTLEALREALSEVVAAFSRYRTYLPYEVEESEEVIKEAVARARQRNPAMENSVFQFLEDVLLGNVNPQLKKVRRAWTGRFQQYTAPVAAKGVEDTAFYRYFLLVALNEVGGEPDHFSVPLQSFHSHCRYRALRYACNLLATATHDHKRGEDTRMRLLAIAEVPREWEDVVAALGAVALKHRKDPVPGRSDEYLFFQVLAALWHDSDRDALTERMKEYMLKATRESKLNTSWINQDDRYEGALMQFVEDVISDPQTDAILNALSERLSELGFFHTLTQIVLKFTSPGVPDVYQGSELLDLTLVDPDNRRPVDYDERAALLDGAGWWLETPSPEGIVPLVEAYDARAKFFLTAALLQIRRRREDLFTSGQYTSIEVSGDGAEHWVGFSRTTSEEAALVLVPRFPASLAESGPASVRLSEELAEKRWLNVFTGEVIEPTETIDTDGFSMPWTVLVNI